MIENNPNNPFGGDKGPSPEHFAAQKQAISWGKPQEHAGPAWADNAGLGDHEQRLKLSRVFMNWVNGWMAAGLAVSGIAAFLTLSSPALLETVAQYYWFFFIAELGMVFGLSAMLPKMSARTAAAMFIAYAALNGLTLSLLALIYTATSITKVFFITAGTYGAMAAIGITTKRDLTSMGSFLMMGVIAIFLAIIVNIFIGSTALDMAISVIGVLVFAGLTAYDIQKFKRAGYLGFANKEQAGRTAIMGALNLYLDFINMFIFLLRLFGDRR